MQKYSIIYEDDSILLINKPQGLATTPGAIKNLCEMIFEDYPYLARVNGYKINEGGLLNRLDNETGGIIFFAKNDEAFWYYSKQMKSEKIEKIYTAVVNGIPHDKNGIIDIPIAHHYKSNKKMVAVFENAKFRGHPQPAKTFWKLIKTNNSISILEIMIKKGVRHQIRLHLAQIGLPIIGDKLYNKNNQSSQFANHLLYANGVRFFSKAQEKIQLFIDVPFLKEIA